MARSSNRHISCIVSVGTNSGSQTFGCYEKENFVIVQNEKIFQEVLFQTQGLAPPYLVLLMQQCCLKKLPSTCTSCQQLPIVHSSPHFSRSSPHHILAAGCMQNFLDRLLKSAPPADQEGGKKDLFNHCLKSFYSWEKFFPHIQILIRTHFQLHIWQGSRMRLGVPAVSYPKMKSQVLFTRWVIQIVKLTKVNQSFQLLWLWSFLCNNIDV